MRNVLKLKNIKADIIEASVSSHAGDNFLDLYAKMVSEGSWKDYGLSISSKQVGFSVFKNAAENALYKICKNF